MEQDALFSPIERNFLSINSKFFKSLMHAYLPEWEELERELKAVLKEWKKQ